MVWINVVMIAFSCVMMIHMGLVDAVLEVLKLHEKKIPVITCPKCSTFWVCVLYLIITRHKVIPSVATSFLASYCAIWFDLLLGQIDMMYEKIYERISCRKENVSTAVHDKKDRKRKSKDGRLS